MAKIKAIEKANRERLLKVNPDLTDKSGIYFLTRTDEDGISYFYIGQAVHILSRLCSHLTGYQHIDLSIKKRGFYSDDNPYGWKINFIYYPVVEIIYDGNNVRNGGTITFVADSTAHPLTITVKNGNAVKVYTVNITKASA